MLRQLFLIALTVTLSACSYIYGDQGIVKNRDTEYLKAKSTPPLKMPPDVSATGIETHYPLSNREYPPQNAVMNLTPPDIAPAPSKQKNVAPTTTTEEPVKKKVSD